LTSSTYGYAINGINTSGVDSPITGTGTQATFTYVSSGYGYTGAHIQIFNPMSAVVKKMLVTSVGQNSGYSAFTGRSGAMFNSTTTTYDGFTILGTSALTGTLRVYGYSKGGLTQPQQIQPYAMSAGVTGSIAVGDVVRVYGTTDMLQIGGMDFEVTALTSNVSATLNIDASGFAAPASAGSVQLIVPNRMYPRWRYIVPLSGAAGITQAANAVVSFSVAHNFTVGEKVSFRVPSAYGMSEINNVTATVQSVTTYTITVDVDTTSFTAFAFPTSAVADAGTSPAIVVPAGAGAPVGIGAAEARA